jgi:hypothetical protein
MGRFAFLSTVRSTPERRLAHYGITATLKDADFVRGQDSHSARAAPAIGRIHPDFNIPIMYRKSGFAVLQGIDESRKRFNSKMNFVLSVDPPR